MASMTITSLEETLMEICSKHNILISFILFIRESNQAQKTGTHTGTQHSDTP